MTDGIDLCMALTGLPINRAVVIDTETTGLNPYLGDEIVSIAICSALGKPIYKSLVKPTKHESWPEAERINHISPSMVKSSPTIDSIAHEIRSHLPGDVLVVGYNVRFDIEFLLEEGVIEEWPRSTFDVMREYALVHGSRRNGYGSGYMYSKLEACARSYGHEFSAHDAMEDALATAYCFRALLCDEGYVRLRMKKRYEGLSRFSVSQTKATTEAILDLVNRGITSSESAELKVGEVTRGKNKGAPRYECFVDNRCVGVSSPSSINQIRAIYFLSDGSSFPTTVPCKATLKASGEHASCEVIITPPDKRFDKMLSIAALARSQGGVDYRRVRRADSKSKTDKERVMDQTEARGAENESSVSGSESKFAAVIFAISLAIILLFMASVFFG